MKDETKKCEMCGTVKPLSDFSKSYRNRCKSCVAEMTRNNRMIAKTISEIQPYSSKVEYVVSARFMLVQSAMVALIDKKGGNRAGLIAIEAVEIADAVLTQMHKTDPLKEYE